MTRSQGAKLCLIEDDPIMGESLIHRFALEGVACDWHQAGQSVLDVIGKVDYAAIVSDIRLPDLSGEALFRSLLELQTVVPPTIFITGYGSIDQAVRLLQLGARDYLTKPFDLDELLDKLRALCPEVFGGPDTDDHKPALGISAVMRDIQHTLRRVSGHEASVLITGESGVGKEYAARYLFRCAEQSREWPFIAINCASLPESLLEAELFGYRKGAFTGAIRDYRGVFQRAHGGMLLLDEIGEMSPAMQAKLLRTIQEGTVQPIGSEDLLGVDVRLVCATNRDLKMAVSRGGFREDLYYRINVVHIHIPPLRERKDDILWFARRFVDAYARKHQVRRYLMPLSERFLRAQPWPGNIRELRHAVERACILAQQEILGPRELGALAAAEDATAHPQGGNLKEYLQACEQRLIRETLEAHQWRIAESAASLGISRKNLWEKMRRHGIQAEPDAR